MPHSRPRNPPPSISHVGAVQEVIAAHSAGAGTTVATPEEASPTIDAEIWARGEVVHQVAAMASLSAPLFRVLMSAVEQLEAVAGLQATAVRQGPSTGHLCMRQPPPPLT